MRLTKTHKEAFVRAVLNDIPLEDWQGKAEEIVRAHIAVAAGYEVAELIAQKSPCLGEEVRVRMPYGLSDIYTYAGPYKYNGFKVQFPKEWSLLEDLAKANKKQKGMLSDVRKNLSGAIAPCSTLKQAKEVFPDLIKYLPSEGTTKIPNSNLPAVIFSIDTLTSLGFPKDKDKEKKK